ncbi:hypothetical protein FWG95_02125 [Candidatus Saccharibacteria bacterium]|nr:hypothetical protein [Candidatus Saccharibacteria bacterium]
MTDDESLRCHSGLDPESNQSSHGSRNKSEMTNREKLRILLLEDDKWLAESLFEMLRDDFEIRVVNNPEKVFDVMETWWPDVMLADVVLGAKNLFVLLHEMQSYVDTRVVPTVILSSISQQISVSDLEKFNVRKVLDKAKITPDGMRQALREIALKGEAVK